MNNSIKLDAPLDKNAKYSLVPEDFPRPFHAGSITGAQPKVLMVEYEGKLYLPGATPPERYDRWDICEDLAKQFGQKSLESKKGKRSHMLEVDILQQYLERLLETGWVSNAEGRWVIQRAASLINWPALEVIE